MASKLLWVKPFTLQGVNGAQEAKRKSLQSVSHMIKYNLLINGWLLNLIMMMMMQQYHVWIVLQYFRSIMNLCLCQYKDKRWILTLMRTRKLLCIVYREARIQRLTGIFCSNGSLFSWEIPNMGLTFYKISQNIFRMLRSCKLACRIIFVFFLLSD